jgi:thymidylate synthase (FAD)
VSESVVFKTIQECGLELVSYTVMNSDETPCADFQPCSAARASFGKESKTGFNVEADKKLMGYLAEHQHLTPFEYNYATFLVEAPLFVHEQIKQHRSIYGLTMPNNAISRRYTSEQIGFWTPDKWRKQSSSNKQASTEETVYEEVWVDTGFDRGPSLLKVFPRDGYEMSVDLAVQVYEQMLEMGVCREQARAVLPQSLLTRFYLGGNLREWAMFLKLRTAKEGVQFETRYVAERVEKALRELWPVATEKLFSQIEED